MRPCSGTSDAAIAVIGVIGHCLPGTQNVSVYTFFAFGNINGRGILSQTAKVGAFDDVNGDGIPQTGEWDKENNYTGVATPDGIPDAYFESSNVDDLQDKLMATISSIIRRTRRARRFRCWPHRAPAKALSTRRTFIRVHLKRIPTTM